MNAVPGLPTSWPRRRRVAGFARGSASGGVIPIPVDARERLSLRQRLLERVCLLPGIATRCGAGASASAVRLALDEGRANGPAHAFLERRDLAEITAAGDVLLRLPPDTRGELLRAGWIQDEGSCLRVPGARRSAEAEVVWRVLLCAYEFATGAPAREPAETDGAAARRLPPMPLEAAGTGVAI